MQYVFLFIFAGFAACSAAYSSTVYHFRSGIPYCPRTVPQKVLNFFRYGPETHTSSPHMMNCKSKHGGFNMSDLAATNCGCGCEGGCGNGNNCSWLIILILLFCCCGNGNGLGCGNDSCGGNNSCIWIILLLFCCGGCGNGCGNGCGFGC